MMIETAILTMLNLLRSLVDDLTTRIAVCERSQEKNSEVSTLKVELADMRKYVDYLQSTDFISLLEATDGLDAPMISEIHLTTTTETHREEDDVDWSYTKIDEDKIEVREEIMHRDLSDLIETKEIMIDVDVQGSLVGTPFVVSNGFSDSR